MAKKSAPSVAPDAQDAFNSAIGFHEAAVRTGSGIYNPASHKVVAPTAPTVVNTAFAAELHMKAIALRRLPDVQGHNLEWLFNKALNQEERETIAKHFKAQTGRGLDELSADLAGIAPAFVEWRYVYESDKRNIDAEALHEFAKAAYLAVRELEPSWPVEKFLHDRIVNSRPYMMSAEVRRGGYAFGSSRLDRLNANLTAGEDKSAMASSGWAIFNHKGVPVGPKSGDGSNEKDGSSG